MCSCILVLNDDELCMIWSDVVLMYFKVLTKTYLEEMRMTTRNLSSEIQHGILCCWIWIWCQEFSIHEHLTFWTLYLLLYFHAPSGLYQTAQARNVNIYHEVVIVNIHASGMARWLEGNARRYGGRGSHGRWPVYGTSFCGLSIVIMCLIIWDFFSQRF